MVERPPDAPATSTQQQPAQQQGGAGINPRVQLGGGVPRNIIMGTITIPNAPASNGQSPAGPPAGLDNVRLPSHSIL